VYVPPGKCVDHFDSVVAQGRTNDALAFCVEGEMIDSPPDVKATGFLGPGATKHPWLRLADLVLRREMGEILLRDKVSQGFSHSAPITLKRLLATELSFTTTSLKRNEVSLNYPSLSQYTGVRLKIP
jgi:hypothetical protein